VTLLAGCAGDIGRIVGAFGDGIFNTWVAGCGAGTTMAVVASYDAGGFCANLLDPVSSFSEAE
jgi:hypothetical protein